jgi:hypothetical protein
MDLVTKLREDADSWEGCGAAIGFLDDEDRARNAERVAYLRAAANRIEAGQKLADLLGLADSSDGHVWPDLEAEVRPALEAWQAAKT